MGVLRIILTIIFIIDCIALSVIVLMQEGKSAGLGTIGGLSETYFFLITGDIWIINLKKEKK